MTILSGYVKIYTTSDVRYKKEEGNTMYETVKEVNGYKITRMVGTQRFYHVSIREGKLWQEFHTFHTIKAAAEFCKSLPTRIH